MSNNVTNILYFQIKKLNSDNERFLLIHMDKYVDE